jgi:hypothetical protein
VTINKDEVGILTGNITANISVLQNLKFYGHLVKMYVVLGKKRKWKCNFKTPSYTYGNKIFMSIYDKQNFQLF